MIVDDDTPVIEHGIEDLSVDQFVKQTVVFTEPDVEAFGNLSADFAAAHFDTEHAQAMGYPGKIVHGLLVASRFSRLMGMYLPGPKSVIQKCQFNFINAVPIGKPLVYTVSIKGISPAVGAVILKLSAQFDEDKDADQDIINGDAVCVISNRSTFAS